MKYTNHQIPKKIKGDFTASLNPFNQNLNYEKILRFSITKVQQDF
jgi:hypothetical protein